MQVGVREESADDAGQLLEPFECAGRLLVEVTGCGDARAADAVVLDVLLDPCVGVGVRGVGRQVEQAETAGGGGDKLFDDGGHMDGVIVDDAASSLPQKSLHTAAVARPSWSRKCRPPWALTAEIRFTLYRAPVEFTTGVCPTGAPVVSQW